MTARAGWTSELGDDDPGTPESRIELLVGLTAAAWAISGRDWPALPRAQWPVRIRLLGDEG